MFTDPASKVLTPPAVVRRMRSNVADSVLDIPAAYTLFVPSLPPITVATHTFPLKFNKVTVP